MQRIFPHSLVTLLIFVEPAENSVVIWSHKHWSTNYKSGHRMVAGGIALPPAMQFWYDYHGFGCCLGNLASYEVGRRNLMKKLKIRWLGDILFSFSWSSILMIKNFDILVFQNTNKLYFESPPNAYSYLGAICLTIVLFFVVYLLIFLYRNSKNKIFRVVISLVFISSLLIVVGYIRESSNIVQIAPDHLLIYFDVSLLIFTGLIGGGALFGIVLFYRRRLGHVFYFAVLVLSPFGLIMMGQLIWGAGTAFALTPKADPFTKNSGPAEVSTEEGVIHRKVIWLVFDTLEPRALFEGRPKGWVFPEFDKLRAEGYYANNVKQTAQKTLLAIPSMLTGHRISETEILPDPDLLIRSESFGGTHRLSQEKTIFHRAHSLGLRSAIVGFYHPYCRFFEGLLSKCLRLAVLSPEKFPRRNLLQVMWLQLRALSIFHRRQSMIDAYKILSERGRAIALDPEIDLAFVHMTVPHKTYVYDSEKQDFTLFNFGITGYFDNIVLADRFLARLRSGLKNRGLWDEVTIVVTADTGWPNSVRYYGDNPRKIPLLIKLPGQTTAVPLPQPFNEPLNGIILHNLVLDLLVGKLTTYKDLEQWLVEAAPS